MESAVRRQEHLARELSATEPQLARVEVFPFGTCCVSLPRRPSG